MDAAFSSAEGESAAVAARFARFARDEAPGRSELYAEWATGVAADAEVTALLGSIPATRRQPPLVFAVTRMLGAPETSYRDWADWLRQNVDAVVAECSARSLQTNEPLRCAALLPALARIDGPLALLEIGASAGLCLYPDLYSYRYRGRRTTALDPIALDPATALDPDTARGPDIALDPDTALDPDIARDPDTALDPASGPSTVLLSSEATGEPPLRMPEVVWRAGIDLEPRDAADPADRSFLTALVWPGETGRAQRITAALEIAAADPPLLVRADATEPGVVRSLAERAPAGATLIVTLPGVLSHMPRAGRERLFAELDELGAGWVSVDPPGSRNHWHPSADPSRWHGFVLVSDGVPLAQVDPLGGFVEWRGGNASAQT